MTVNEKLVYQIQVDAQKSITQIRKLAKEVGNLSGAQRHLDSTLRQNAKQFKDVGVQAKKAESSYSNFAKTAKKSTSDLNRNLLTLYRSAMALYGAFRTLESTIGKGLDFNIMIEKNTKAFEVMTGSAERAVQVIDDLRRLQETTPIGIGEGAEGVKQMLAYGFAVDDAVGSMKLLMTVGSAVGVSLKDMVYVYGTLQAQGRAYTRDLMQFAMRGIPIYEYLAKVMNVSVGEIKDLTEAGAVGFREVEMAMQAMTSEGGVFNNFLEEYMTTIEGSFVRVSRTFETLMGDITATATKEIAKMGTTLFNFLSNFSGTEAMSEVLGSIFQSLGSILDAILPTVMKIADALMVLVDATLNNGFETLIKTLAGLLGVLADLGKFLAGPLGLLLAGFLTFKMANGAALMILGVTKALGGMLFQAQTVAPVLAGASTAVRGFGRALNAAIPVIGLAVVAIVEIATAIGSMVHQAKLDSLGDDFKDLANSIALTEEQMIKIKDAIDMVSMSIANKGMNDMIFGEMPDQQLSQLEMATKLMEHLMEVTGRDQKFVEELVLSYGDINDAMREQIELIREAREEEERKAKLVEDQIAYAKAMRDLSISQFESGVGAGPMAIGVSYENVTGRSYESIDRLGPTLKVDESFNAETVWETYSAPLKAQIANVDAMLESLAKVGVSSANLEETRNRLLGDVVSKLKNDLNALQESDIITGDMWPILQSFFFTMIDDVEAKTSSIGDEAEKVSWALKEWRVKITSSKVDDLGLDLEKEIENLKKELGEGTPAFVEASALATTYFNRQIEATAITEEAQRAYASAMAEATTEADKLLAEYNLNMEKVNSQIAAEGEATQELINAKKALTYEYLMARADQIRSENVSDANLAYYTAMSSAVDTATKVDDLLAEQARELAIFNAENTSLAVLDVAAEQARSAYQQSLKGREEDADAAKKALDKAEAELAEALYRRAEIEKRYAELIKDAEFEEFSQSLSANIDPQIEWAELMGDTVKAQLLRLDIEDKLAIKQHELGIITDAELVAKGRYLTVQEALIKSGEDVIDANQEYIDAMGDVSWANNMSTFSEGMLRIIRGFEQGGQGNGAAMGFQIGKGVTDMAVADATSTFGISGAGMANPALAVAEVIMTVMSQFENMSKLLSPANMLLEGLVKGMDSLDKGIGALLAPVEKVATTIGEALAPVFATISAIIYSVVAPAFSFLGIVAQMLGVVFEFIYPIVAVVGNVLVFMGNIFVAVGNALMSFAETITFWDDTVYERMDELEYLPLTVSELKAMGNKAEEASKALEVFSDKLGNTIDYVSDRLKEMVDAQIDTARELYEVGAITAQQYEEQVRGIRESAMTDEQANSMLIDESDLTGMNIDDLVNLLNWLNTEQGKQEELGEDYQIPSSVPSHLLTPSSSTTSQNIVYNSNSFVIQGSVLTERDLAMTVAEAIEAGRLNGYVTS